MKKLLVTLVVAIMATLAISVVAFGEEISLYAQEVYAQEVVGFELESVGLVGITAFGNGNNNLDEGGGGSGPPPPVFGWIWTVVDVHVCLRFNTVTPIWGWAWARIG